ncbi:MAG: hypothetical protein M1834_009722 [Cirrosporium novae-zelandiae]|nr:MAG: hypothetical protein M1834_009722 [Cirrosporium novae-zelandiae]
MEDTPPPNSAPPTQSVASSKNPPSSSKMPSSFRGINHLKLPATDILKTSSFYTTIFPFTRLPHYDHFTPDHKLFAVMFAHAPTNLIVEIRHVPDQVVSAQRGWDPITWGVDTRADLEEWGTWFDANGVRRSRVLRGIKGWVLCCEDPDGRVVRVYCEEEHEWTDFPDRDEFWLGRY